MESAFGTQKCWNQTAPYYDVLRKYILFFNKIHFETNNFQDTGSADEELRGVEQLLTYLQDEVERGQGSDAADAQAIGLAGSHRQHVWRAIGVGGVARQAIW